MRDAATGRFLRENSTQWKGGRYKAKGYWYVMVATLPPEQQAIAQGMRGKSGYVREHRLMAALARGRSLSPVEHVHHLNGVKDDNRPENLVILERREHSLRHREVEKELAVLRAENTALRAELSALK